MPSNVAPQSETDVNEAVPEKKKTAYEKFRKAVINTFMPLRQNYISGQFKDQDKFNDWIEKLILQHHRELILLRKELDAEMSANQALRREDLAKSKRTDSTVTPEKEDEVVEPEEEKETVSSELTQQEPEPDRNEKATEEDEIVEPKEEKKTVSPVSSPLEEPEPTDGNEKATEIVEEEEKPKEKKRGIFAKLFKRKSSKVEVKDEEKDPKEEVISEKRDFLTKIFGKKPAK